MSRGYALLLSLCLVELFFFNSAKAESLAPITQTLHIDLGVFLMSTDTTVRVDGSAGSPGTDIDLDRDFNFQDQDRFRIDGYWRFAKRHKVRFMYFDSSSSSDKKLTKDIHFGDTTFPVNASAHLGFETQIIEAAYEYSFVQNDVFDLAASIGLHNISISTELSAAVSGPLGGGGANLSSSADTNGPLPVLGLHFIWALSNQFYFDGYAQFFKVSIDNYDGHLSDYKFDFVWQPIKYFGMGIGYNQFTTRLDVAQDRFSGRLKFGYGGPLLFVSTAF